MLPGIWYASGYRRSFLKERFLENTWRSRPNHSLAKGGGEQVPETICKVNSRLVAGSSPARGTN
jgi:hypothetical protein